METDGEGAGEVFTVSQDFKADDADAVTVHRGEKVVLVETKGKDTSKWKIQSLEDPRRQGWVPIVVLTPHEESPERLTKQDVIYRREAVISELVETEEEFCRDLMQVVDRYLRPLDAAGVPRNVTDNKQLLFGNFKEIAIFHNTVLLEGIKYYANEPKSLGRAFLRMERDFDKHVAYCHDEAAAQNFLQTNDKVRDFFDDLGARLHDDKTLSEHLKLPIQRINDYQLLLKELVKYSERLGEDTTDLNKALELMLGIPHRAEDLKFITNIEGYHGDIHKLGRLLRHNWFKVTGRDGKTHDRYLFLFKARILVCKVRKIAEDRYVFVLKEIIRLPDVEVKDHQFDPKTFEVGPFTFTSDKDHVKDPWLAEIKHYARNALTLAEHQADDLRLQEEGNEKLEPLKGVELLTPVHSISNSEEEMAAPRRTSLSKRVEELRTSITESPVRIPASPVMETPEVDTTSHCNTDGSLFLRTIKGINVRPGGCATFECEIEAESIFWLKDNKPISDRMSDRMTWTSEGNVHRLEILNVCEADAGVYTAHAKTAKGETSTCTANLVVKELSDEEKRALAEANAPNFMVKLKDTELLRNTYLRFMVKVRGQPNPVVEFYKDEDLITYENERIAIISDKGEDGYYEVVIPNVKQTDAGVYKCKATNKFGEATCEGVVTVVDSMHSPSRSPTPEEKNVFEGLDEEVPPPSKEPEFLWLRDGKPFNPEERFKVLFQEQEDSLALVFTHVKPEDAGLYTCVASTQTGKISCSAELTVQGNVNVLFREPEAPTIKTTHKEIEANIGSSAMLETKTSGYPKPEIKWYKNDEEIVMNDRIRLLYEDEETISLVIKSVTMEDCGEYKAVSINCAGKSEATTTLFIKAPPSFTQKLRDIKTIAGEELKLTVQVEANPKPNVVWFKDGKELKDNDHIKIIEDGSSYTLLIEKCTLFDVGSYSVICKNEISQSSEFCKVDIEGPPIFTRNLIKKVDLEEGDSLAFLVKVFGNPMPSVKWLFDGKPVVADQRCKISNDVDTYTLTVNSIKRGDAGEYSCQLMNAHGTNVDCGNVTVKCSPKFTKPLGNLVAQEGDENVGFSVNVESHPKGKVKWFHNEEEITESNSEYTFKEEENSFSLVIKKVMREASGKYKCRIQNEYGSEDSFADLTVLCKPIFKKQLQENVRVDVGKTLTLQVEVNSTPEPQIKWYKDGQEVVTSDARIKISRDSQRIETYELTVDLVRAEDSGEYEVRALNEMGAAVTKTTVTVQTSPQITKTSMEDTEVFETWENTYEIEVIGTPRPEAKWYKDGEEVIGSEKFVITDSGEKYKLEILDCQLEDAGEYKVVVSNIMGEASHSAQFKVRIAKDFRLPQILTPLIPQEVHKNNTAVLTVVLTADPIPEIQWEHDGREVDAEFVQNCESKKIHHGLKECIYTLTIPSSKHADTGTYRFYAANKSGEAETNARLDIILMPEMEMFKDAVGIPYEEAEFIAILHSNPRAEITWRKDGNKIEASDHIEITTDHVNEIYKLKVKNIHLEDGGVYTISAVNNLGEISVDAKLKIHMEEPIFTKALENLTIREYAELDMKVRAEGVPKPEIRCQFYGVPSKGDTERSKDGEDLVAAEGMTLDTRCEGQVSSHLNIPHFKPEHEGTYKVRAYSVAGYIDSVCAVKLAVLPPTFSKVLERAVEVGEGEPLELHCKVEASPLATVKWTKNGEPLTESDHVKLSYTPDGFIKLRIDQVTTEDCGAYKVYLENIHGKESAISAVAIIPSPRRPTFIKRLQDAALIEGEPLLLEAKVMAFPLPEVKWYKDGLPVRQTRSINFINSPGGVVGLSIDQVTPEHAGAYSLTVVNRLGEASSDAQVQITMKDRTPEFQMHLTPLTVVEGFPAKFTIKVGGIPLPHTTWLLNGTAIDIDGGHIKILESPNGTQSLVIDKATQLDSGIYTVTATNPAGSISSQAKLIVADQVHPDMPEEKPSFAHGLRDTWAEEGSLLAFSVPFAGNPVPEISWFKNDIPVIPDYRSTLINDGHKISLQINPCDMRDAGVFKCKLVNPLGIAESEAKATIKKVFHAPVFSSKLRHLEQVIGLDGKLTCRVSGNPRPDVLWYKNERPLCESNKYHMKRDGDVCLLYIRECEPDDDGVYKCVATNKDGKDECEAKFKAVEKILTRDKGEAPCFLKKIGDQEVINGVTGRFTACISGYPDPEVEWCRNNDRLFPSDRITMERETTGLIRLTISKIDVDLDCGLYKLRIYNDFGEDECEASFINDSMGMGQRRPVGEQYKDFEDFKHTGAPLPLPDRPIISRMSDRRLTLSWRPSIPIGPRDPVTYQVELCEIPNGDWITVRSGIRSCSCEVRNLEKYKDYKFRVRVENKYGLSEPSPFTVTFRGKIEPEPPKFIPYLAPGMDFRPEGFQFFPKDFDIERPPQDGYAQAPRFLRQEKYTQYGVKGHNTNLFWFIHGYPKPKVSFTFNDEAIEMGGRYDSSYTRNGQATLFINKMLERDVGWYEAIAINEHGEARQRVHLQIAEHPEFNKRLDEMTLYMRQGGRLEARVTGLPVPEIKWYKDWQPLATSSRFKISRVDPDHCYLSINDIILKDAGLYSISATNVAGTVSSSVMIHVEEREERPFHLYGRGHNVSPRNKLLRDLYDLGDELGRGTQGVTYHAVERYTGRNYAAKIMHGQGELKRFMNNELEIMNQLNSHKLIKIHDAFETLDSMILVIELAGGGEILDCLTKQPYTTESEIARYIRQLLVGLDHMHEQNIAHLGLTPGDLLITHPGSDDLKICDFGLSRRIHPGQLAPLEYGMPEFVSPEIIKGEGVDLNSDLWSVGVITHLLLTGVSLFRGNNDMETLTKVREGFWEFDEDLWCNLSVTARDFVSKLLVVDAYGRMDVKAALRHPWLNAADRLPTTDYTISTQALLDYYNLWKDWYSNASCRNWYRRRPLMGAFTHPSHMVYPPNYIATPSETPERELKEKTKTSWIEQLPSRQPLNYDMEVVSSESHYQNGPDTYLLQLRDVDFPVRIREYMKVAANRGLGMARFSEDSHLDLQLPVIRERRRFTDVMDEEIDDERKQRINQYRLGDSYSVRRLKHELGTRLDAHVEAEALIEATREGQAPFMREKPQTTPIEENKNAQLVCYAVGEPKPSIQWFKNEMMIASTNRMKILEDEKGRSILQFTPATAGDAGIYKAVARNRLGQTVCRARVVLATFPDAPDSPQESGKSDHEVLLRWKQPKFDGNSPVFCYSVQYKTVDDSEWRDTHSTIDHEFYLVRGLQPATGYIFRIAAQNSIGWSPKGIPTEEIRTLEEGCPPVEMSQTMRHLQSIAESGQEIIEEPKEELDYNLENNPVEWRKHNPTEKYNFISEIYRGRFSVVVKAIDKTCDKVVVAKLLEYSTSTEQKVNSEYEALRSLRHERIATLMEAYKPPDATYCVFVLEKLQGSDVLTYLASRHEYTEQMVATIISQVLDALQYLHWRGLCHLDIQPDNVVMASVRSTQIKLVDLGCSQKVTKLGTVVKPLGALEFSAPEVLCQEASYPQSDIWSVGVLTYVLLSGASPFLGETPAETRQNINFVRFRFEYLFKELTQEATRFIMLVFKRAPNKRPNAEECHEHRWLLPTDYMIKRRERAVFLGVRLKEFCDRYHKAREEEASSLEALTCLVSGKGPLARSSSVAEELTAAE